MHFCMFVCNMLYYSLLMMGNIGRRIEEQGSGAICL